MNDKIEVGANDLYIALKAAYTAAGKSPTTVYAVARLVTEYNEWAVKQHPPLFSATANAADESPQYAQSQGETYFWLELVSRKNAHDPRNLPWTYTLYSAKAGTRHYVVAHGLDSTQNQKMYEAKRAEGYVCFVYCVPGMVESGGKKLDLSAAVEQGFSEAKKKDEAEQTGIVVFFHNNCHASKIDNMTLKGMNRMLKRHTEAKAHFLPYPPEQLGTATYRSQGKAPVVKTGINRAEAKHALARDLTGYHLEWKV